MNRRHFLLGTGGAALGGGALIGSGAFSGVVSKRKTEIAVAHDENAYLGLKRSDGPNRSFVGYDGKGHLYLKMDRKNPTEGGGEGVNSDSHTYFDDLFHICNQGKESAWIFLFKRGEKPEHVTFYHGGLDTGYESIGGQKLAVSDCLDVGLVTDTKSLHSSTRLLRKILIVAIADSAFEKSTRPSKILDTVDVPHDDEWVLNSQP